jgi:RNA polymerase sigma-70 factor (ECF subfamily)
VPEQAFLAYLTARHRSEGEPHGVAAADLYLACACARGDERAIALFERELFPLVDEAVAAFKQPAHFIDEVKQALREKLFVAEPGEEPRITRYSGRGPLANWVRISALRTAVNLLRDGAAQTLDPLHHLPRIASHSLEVDYLRKQHSEQIHHALAAAMAALPERQRVALKLQLLDGLTLQQIGRVFQVDASSVSRWIARAKKTVLRHVLRSLGDSLAMPRTELESLVRLIQSQLEISLRGVFAQSK